MSDPLVPVDCATRKAAVLAAQADHAALLLQAQNEKAAQLDAHFERVLCSWVKSEHDAAIADGLKLPVSAISAAAQTDWKARLEAQGYAVSIDSTFFSITMP